MTFEDFWALYPRKTNKAQARRAWIKLMPGQFLFDQMAENISERLKAGEWSDKQYIPHASTYLNNERWEDEVIAKTSGRTTLEQDLTDYSWATNVIKLEQKQ